MHCHEAGVAPASTHAVAVPILSEYSVKARSDAHSGMWRLVSLSCSALYFPTVIDALSPGIGPVVFVQSGNAGSVSR
eukprot:SAG31_NODE_627_length_13445_cov_18.311053_12_plen_77_part_00